MKEIKVTLEPPDVEPNDFEDLLATDDLFIEYFNTFLALPTFPEPLCFNKETDGFELVTDAKKKLAEEIKAAVRAGQRRKRIYRPVRNHAFSNIPLIPMEEPPLVEEKEIDTSFTVKTLNKEQGIEWIKKERLPAFLESDVYLEYQLSKLVSQAQPTANLAEVVSLKVDNSIPARPPRKPNTLLVQQDHFKHEEQSLMKDMFVCMGNASTTDTEAWVSQAKMVQNLGTSTSTSRPRPTSAISPRSMRPHSGRPVSAVSAGGSTSRRSDSGVWSPTKSSGYGSNLDVTATYSNSISTLDEDLDEDDNSRSGNPRFSSADGKLYTPRLSDRVCLVADDGRSTGLSGGTVYAAPSSQHNTTLDDISSDTESLFSEVSQLTSNSSQEDFHIDSMTSSPVQVDSDMVFHDIDELGAVIVGTILCNALAEITGKDKELISQSSTLVKDLISDEKYRTIDFDNLGNLCFVPKIEEKQQSGEMKSTDGVVDKKVPCPPSTPKQAFKPNSQPRKPEIQVELAKTPSQEKNRDKDSDEDSLLNSDDDYEQDRDAFFRKKKRKLYMLTNKKGLAQFKKFLMGTTGEKNWYFWLDVERAKLITNQQELGTYMVAMRERYQKHGASFELSRETKAELGLTEPSHFNLERLSKAQARMVEPLILYWGPRFLLKQQLASSSSAENNYMYLQQKMLSSEPSEPHPSPPTVSLLPLRPRTCMPRVRHKTNDQPKKLQISSMFEESATKRREAEEVESLPVTTPRVGQRRRYSIPDMYKTTNQKKDKEKANKEKQHKLRSPKDLITPVLKSARPRTAIGIQRAKSGESSEMPSEMVKSGPHRPRTAQPSTAPSRPGSAQSRATSATSATTATGQSDFLGGRRMEGLLAALYNEKKAGSVLKKYLHLAGNELWKNCLQFWLELQEYHKMFYSEVLDVYRLEKKAKSIYSQYIVIGCSYSIDCKQRERDLIHNHLTPPFEELFDMAEEHILEVLYEAWSQMVTTDLSTFEKVELIEEKRHLDAKSKYVFQLQRRGIIKERPVSPDDPMAGYQDPVYDDTIFDRIPEEFADYTLEKLVHNRIELEHFRQFLAENYASMDLMCWMDMEAFRRIPHTEEHRRDMKAKDIKTKYLNKKYFFGPNSPAGKESQDKVMQAGGGWGKKLDDRPPTAIIVEAQKYVHKRLEKKWLPLFLITAEFADRQRPQSRMDDVVEDVMIQRKKKSQAIWKMLESRWVSSSKDIITFRKALLNPVTSLQFRRYVSIKGDNYENDVLFWQEVQRYKDLCHQHSDRALIQQKTVAIIHCFLDSPIPPSLQIDVPQEMADNLVDRKMEATPYLFREAQLTVFRVLFNQWTDFCQFRSNLTEDKILPTIERHRRRAKAEDRKRRKEEEDKREKELARKRALGIPIDPNEDIYQDPFEKMQNVASEDDDESIKGPREAVTWSYSSYVQALDKEEVLNEVDHNTFTSVIKPPRPESSNGKTDNSDTSSLRPSSSGSSRGKRKPSKPEAVPVKPAKAKVTAESGSQVDLRPKIAMQQARVGSSKGRPEPPKPTTNGHARMHQSVHNEPDERPRLARKMPPLVSKR